MTAHELGYPFMVYRALSFPFFFFLTALLYDFIPIRLERWDSGPGCVWLRAAQPLKQSLPMIDRTIFLFGVAERTVRKVFYGEDIYEEHIRDKEVDDIVARRA